MVSLKIKNAYLKILNLNFLIKSKIHFYLFKLGKIKIYSFKIIHANWNISIKITRNYKTVLLFMKKIFSCKNVLF